MRNDHSLKPGFLGKYAVMLLALSLGGSAAAQSNDALLRRAYAAGYKAQFLCSGLFNGGKTAEQIERDELTGIYPEIADIVPTLPAKIDQTAKRVTVAYAENTPPRAAIHGRTTGCTAMPIGWTPHTPKKPTDNDIISYGLPSALYDRLAPGSLDTKKWPMGDAGSSNDKAPGSAAAKKLIIDILTSGKFGGKSSAALVVRGGQIIAEDYALGHNLHTGQRTWSVAKSITGTYAGFVRQQSSLALDIPGLEGLAPIDPRSKIMLENLLRMASGLHSDYAGNRSDHIYLGGAPVRQHAATGLLLRAPGTHFRYANNDILLAALAIRNAAPDIHPHHLFDKLGMTRTFAETDHKGDYILSSQVWTTPRDLARMGMLYLNNGTWNGERLLPENWREFVSTPSGPQPFGAFGYGATFWLMNKSDGIPADTFAAFGNRGQYLVIIPSMDMIIVRRGYDSTGKQFDIEAFTRAMVAAAARP